VRTAFFLLFLAAWMPSSPAGPCTGAEPQLARISRALARDDQDFAEQNLASIEASYPGCPEIILDRARLSAAKGKAAEAESLFDRYTKDAVDDSRGYAFFGRFWLEQRKYDRADALSVVALEKNPGDPAALVLRGEILAMKGETQQAIVLLEKACELEPEDAQAHFELGTIYDRGKRTADAARHFQQVVGINPRDARAWDYLALNLEPLGEVSRAEQAYRQGLAVNERGRNFDAFLDYNYGRFLMKTNNLAESKKHLDRAVELTPRIRGPWYERAKLNLRLKDFEQARNDAEQAANLADPAGIIIDLQMWVLLEQVYSRLGQTELANKYAELGRNAQVPARKDQR
jgi:tetratricopeptide (TPR) repeat protein